MEIFEIPIGKVEPYENNPRHNDGAVDAVAASIREFGWQQPIVIDRNGVIIAGHTRYKAAIKLGCAKIPVVKADDLTDEQVRAFRLADNKTAELAEWDESMLAEELAMIDDIDMADFGFEPPTAETENDESEETATPGFEYKPQFGVIVICQDETEQGDVYAALTAEGYDCKKIDT